MNEFGIEMIPVSSSNVVAVGYDETNQLLYVEFKRNSLYRYQGIQFAVFNDLLNASSVGGYLAQNIKKGGYPYEQLR